MRLIDANKLLNKSIIVKNVNSTGRTKIMVDRNDIDNAPTIDAEPVIHGHWVIEKDYMDGEADYKCSNCEFDWTFNKGTPEHFFKRCPHCGAKMDEEAGK